MLLHCDYVAIAEDAKLSTPFVSLGAGPGGRLEYAPAGPDRPPARILDSRAGGDRDGRRGRGLGTRHDGGSRCGAISRTVPGRFSGASLMSPIRGDLRVLRMSPLIRDASCEVQGQHDRGSSSVFHNQQTLQCGFEILLRLGHGELGDPTCALHQVRLVADVIESDTSVAVRQHYRFIVPELEVTPRQHGFLHRV